MLLQNHSVWFLLLFLCALSCDSKPKADATPIPQKTATSPVLGTSMLSLSDSERAQKMAEDLVLIQRYDRGLDRVLSYATSHPEFFPRDEIKTLTPQQKDELRTIWQTVLDYMRALDGVKHYWRDFHKINFVKNRRAHAEAFLVGYAAWSVQYRHGLRFVDLTVPSKLMEKLLDEPSSRYDIGAGEFRALKWNIINVKAVARLMGSHQYYKTVASAVAEEPSLRWATKSIASFHKEALSRLKERAAIQFSYNAYDIVRDRSFDAWFPVQKNVAEWMGDTRVHRLHSHLVGSDNLETLKKVMEPADILVVRSNWYLSNIGLPGFWPHAEIYLGDPATLSAYFDVPEVNAYLRATYDLDKFTDVLRRESPAAAASYLGGQSTGEPFGIMEAVSEGVVFSTLSHGAGVDYVGVMRPNRTKVEKARALIRAFSYFGRPYDFNFDFVTDESIVCTELVYKSWQPDIDFRGLPLNLVKMMGRQTLPANEVVRQFDLQYDEPDRRLEFVTFFDGREKEKTSVASTLQAFRSSWRRPKWDVLQK